jgi:hypothetical protein
MLVDIHILRADDGAVGVVKGYEWDNASEYDWADGNHSCDCNRSIHFNRARGMANAEAFADRVVCGDGGFPVMVIDAAGVLVFKG